MFRLYETPLRDFVLSTSYLSRAAYSFSEKYVTNNMLSIRSHLHLKNVCGCNILTNVKNIQSVLYISATRRVTLCSNRE